MCSKEKMELIIKEMERKEIKKNSQKYIVEYIELNIKLFPFLDIEILKERLIENFNKISPNFMSPLYKNLGEYIPTTGKILIAPNLYYGKNRKYKETVILHELDHCACSPTIVKKEYEKFKKEFYLKNKIHNQIIPDVILSEMFYYNYKIGPLTGITNFKQTKNYTKQKLITGTNWVNHLNEGITSMKQLMYSKELGIKFHKHKDFYYGARMGVNCLVRILGFEKVIKLHFNNNLVDMENEFNLKISSITLDELMLNCLKYDNNKSKRNLKKLRELLLKVEQEIE